MNNFGDWLIVIGIVLTIIVMILADRYYLDPTVIHYRFKALVKVPSNRKGSNRISCNGCYFNTDKGCKRPKTKRFNCHTPRIVFHEKAKYKRCH